MGKHRLAKVKVKINGQVTTAVLDTGASAAFMSTQEAQRLGLTANSKDTTTYLSISVASGTTAGSCLACIDLGGATVSVKLWLVDNPSMPILLPTPLLEKWGAILDMRNGSVDLTALGKRLTFMQEPNLNHAFSVAVDTNIFMEQRDTE
ncbi:hypothetical protein LPJ73_001137 [Coemansia sp. RSA 2703]|nr:hypothetical protein LPJ73_001137 [Coemansia sp. RSA 2703]KAJ2378373.1 hypothetical protein IW150_000846 [Coemansia sp. RSA 2607]KAJ2395909.1 hypothetical protein GGI05_001366 [Coemansia sp. RSA 2603]